MESTRKGESETDSVNRQRNRNTHMGHSCHMGKQKPCRLMSALGPCGQPLERGNEGGENEKYASDTVAKSQLAQQALYPLSAV